MDRRTLILGLTGLAVAAVVASAWWLRPGARSDARAVEIADDAPRDERGAGSGHPAAESASESARGALPGTREARAADAPEDAIRVEGRVVLPPGTPPDEELFVVARGTRSFAGGPLDGERACTAPVDAQGAFQVAFAARSRRGQVTLRARYLHLPGTTRVDLRQPPGEIVLEPLLGGAIRGRVVVAGGEPLEAGELQDVFVRAISADGPRATSPAADGTFELGGLPDGGVFLLGLESPRHVDRGPQGDRLTVRAGHVHEVVLELERGVRLAGRVTEPDGRAVEGASLYAEARRAGRGVAGPTTRTAADGSFTLAGVPAGEVELHSYTPGFVGGHLALGALEAGSVREGIAMVLDPGGAIEGTVRWADGTAAQGARVRVEQEGLELHGPPYEYSGPSEVTTDAHGRFRATGLTSGGCAVTVSGRHPRAEGGGEGPLLLVEALGVEPGGAPLELALGAGPSLAGRVVDDRGTPLERFRVVADRRERGSLRFPGDVLVPDPEFTDRDGRFELPGWPAGTWSLRARLRGGQESEPVEVELPPGRTDLVLVVSRAAELSGQVVAADGSPVPRARVVLELGELRGDPAEFVPALGVRDAQDRTEADGGFTLDDLRPGAARLIASADGHGRSAALVLELAPDERRAGVRLRLRRPARIVGRIDAAAGLVAGRQVTARTLDRKSWQKAVSDAAGRFALDGLSPEPHEVELFPSLPREGSGQPGSSEPLVVRVELREGETTELVLGGPRAGAIRLNGRVTCGGAPIAGAEVDARRMGADAPPVTATSAADGAYALELEAPGQYVLSVGVGRATVLRDAVEITDHPELELDLELPAGRISGVVRDEAGRGIELVEVRVQSASGRSPVPRRATTDAAGRFAIDHLAPGAYALEAGGVSVLELLEERALYGARILEPVELVEGQAVEGVVLELRLAGALRGRVVRAGGTPVEGASIELRDAAGRDPSAGDRRRSDGTGRFELLGLDPGALRVRAVTDETASAWSEVRIESGESAEIELVLPR